MKKLISVLIVLLTVVLIAFAPLLGGRDDVADLPSGDRSAVELNKGTVDFDTEAAERGISPEALAEMEQDQSGDLFGGYPDPATYNRSQVPERMALGGAEETQPFYEDDRQYPAYNGDMSLEEEYDPYPTVLMYHCVHDEPYTKNSQLFVRPAELEKQLQLLCDMEVECIFADEFGPVDKRSVILTFDDGYEDNYTYMFPLIKKYNVKVTVYMIAYKIDKPGYLTTEQIKEMSDSGLVQFGSHTLDHPTLSSLSEDQIRSQFEGSNWLISNITGKSVTTVAYPAGKYNDLVMEVAADYYSFAYTTDATYYWGQDNMMLPRYAILREHTVYSFKNFIE